MNNGDDFKRSAVLRKMQEKKSYRLVGAGLLLALVAAGAAFLITILPSSTATVTITPISRRLTHTYSINMVLNNPQAGQIKGRIISSTMPRQSRTVTVTGKGHHNATHAQGKVVFSQIHFFNPADNNSSMMPSKMDAANGIKIDTDSFTATEGASATVSAHADSAGAGGNIPAYSLDTPVDVYRVLPNGAQGPQVGTAYVQNTGAFTGGQDAYDYTYVRQADIDGISRPLVEQLTLQAQQKIQKQMLSTEQLVQDIACTPDVATDHKASDEASNVTVGVDVKCVGEAYTGQNLFAAATTAHENDALARFGKEYRLAGNITLGLARLVQVLGDGSALYQIPTDGIWVFQIDAMQLRAMAQSVAGRSQRDASALLLSREGLKDVKITTSGGFGSALPTSVTNIKFVLVHISGLTQAHIPFQIPLRIP